MKEVAKIAVGRVPKRNATMVVPAGRAATRSKSSSGYSGRFRHPQGHYAKGYETAGTFSGACASLSPPFHVRR